MLTIDRFEENTAICEAEDGTMICVPVGLLPPGCREGDALIRENGVYKKSDNSSRRQAIKEKMQGLFKKS